MMIIQNKSFIKYYNTFKFKDNDKSHNILYLIQVLQSRSSNCGMPQFINLNDLQYSASQWALLQTRLDFSPSIFHKNTCFDFEHLFQIIQTIFLSFFFYSTSHIVKSLFRMTHKEEQIFLFLSHSSLKSFTILILIIFFQCFYETIKNYFDYTIFIISLNYAKTINKCGNQQKIQIKSIFNDKVLPKVSIKNFCSDYLNIKLRRFQYFIIMKTMYIIYSPNSLRILKVFAIFLFLISRAESIQVAPTWIPSSYVQAASANLINNEKIGNSSTPTATMSFSRSFSSIPQLGYGITAYQGNDHLGQQFFEVNRTRLTSTLFSVLVKISGYTNVWLLVVRYIAIDSLFPHHLNSFDNVPVNYQNGPLRNITTASTVPKFYINNINYTKQCILSGYSDTTFTPSPTNFKILLFMTSLFLDGTNQVAGQAKRAIDMRISAQIKSTNIYTLNVTLKIQIKISRLHFSMIVFDAVNVQASRQYVLIYTKINFAKTGGFIPVPQEFVNNLIMGFTQFSTIQTSSCLHFKLIFRFNLSTHGVLMPASVPRYNYVPFSRFGFSLFYMKTWICPTDTFFDQNIDLCVSCPVPNCIKCKFIDLCERCNDTAGFILNINALPDQQCSQCPIPNCVKCLNLTSCLICDTSNNFFLTKINSTQICMKCQIPFCVSCFNLTFCGLCDNTFNYFLNPLYSIQQTSSQCAPCQIPFCIQCYNLTHCKTCNQSLNYFLNQGMTNITNNIDQCIPCQVLWCIQCQSLKICKQCDIQNGYVLDPLNGQCILCFIQNCLQCKNITHCSICNQDQNFFLNRTLFNQINSTASNQTIIYNLTIQHCSLCNIHECLICLSLTTCSVCDEDSNYFINPSPVGVLDQCILCIISQCQLCSNLTACAFCNTTAGFFLNPSPTSIFDQCVPCPILNCLICENLTSCLTCNETFSYFLNPNFTGLTDMCSLCALSQCIQCSSLQTCSICNSSNNYFLNLTDLNCYYCNISNCLECNTLNTCLVCDNTNLYFLNTTSGQCETPPPVCGDNIIAFIQQCDDGNNLDYDGCSNSCIIQSGFTCELSTITGMFNSICYFIGEITINILYIQKLDLQNQVSILLEVLTSKNFINNDEVLNMIFLITLAEIESYSIIRNSDGTISLLINYVSDIHGMEMTLVIDPAKSGKPQLSRQTSSSRKFPLIPTDNQSLLFYSKQTYDKAKMISILSTLIVALGLLLYILGMFARKLVGVELMGVIQISYLSLVRLSILNPCFKMLSAMWFVNGFNYYNLSKDHLLDQNTTIQIKGMQFYSNFIKNYNFTFLLLIILPLLIALIVFILSRTKILDRWKSQNNLTVLSKQFCCYAVYNGVIFSGYIIAVSIAIQFVYGFKKIQGMTSTLSILGSVVCILIYILYFVLIIKKPAHFLEFVDQFKKTRKQTDEPASKPFLQKINQKWYNIAMIERLIIGTTLIFLLETRFSVIITIIIFLTLGLYCIVKKPYKKTRNNYRFACNMLVCITIQIIYFFYNTSQNIGSQLWQYLALLVCLLLLICIIYNGSFLIYQLFSHCKNTEDKLYQPDQSSLRKLQKNSILKNQDSQTKQNPTSTESKIEEVKNFKIMKQIKGTIINELKGQRLRNKNKKDILQNQDINNFLVKDSPNQIQKNQNFIFTENNLLQNIEDYEKIEKNLEFENLYEMI